MLSSVGYFLWQKNQPVKPTVSVQSIIDISNWKTFTNADFNFTFKYPSDWDFLIKNKAGVVIAPKEKIELLKKITYPSGDGQIESMAIYQQPPSTFNMQSPKPDKLYTLQSEPINVGNLEATKYTLKWLQDLPGVRSGSTTTNIFLKRSNVLYGYYLYDDQFKTIFGQILSTFKFLN